MSWLFRFYKSTIGMKVAMAISGLIMLGFLIVHMAGNLQVFLGAQVVNDYSKMLHEHIGLLWGTRAVLLASVLLHIYSALILTLKSRAARPKDYIRRESQAATYASRTLVYGGFILALFIGYHLMHLTFGNVHPDFREGDAYHNLVSGLSRGGPFIVYVLANTMLGLHLYHGVYSLTRTLGFENARFAGIARAASVLLAGLVAGGNILIAVCIFFRIGIAT